jgi:hypothetical protein
MQIGNPEPFLYSQSQTNKIKEINTKPEKLKQYSSKLISDLQNPSTMERFQTNHATDFTTKKGQN